MINNIKKAINKITWRIGGNGWKATQNDVDAINFIIDFVNVKHKEQINNHQLFAKLYIYVYGQFLKHYNATVFDKIPEQELHKLLERPIDQFIEDFKNQLNSSELYSLQDELGLSNSHPATRTQKEKDNDSKILDQVLNNKESLEAFMGDPFDYELVKENLEAQINNAINIYRNN